MENRRIKRAAWVFAGFLAANLLSSLLSSTTQVNLLRSATVAALLPAGDQPCLEKIRAALEGYRLVGQCIIRRYPFLGHNMRRRSLAAC
ncbi:hypothetical protein ACMV5L_15975 [Serratia plymuthica]|uniref:hypothetical protein n=1 Tax=Serratia plymuthica TaxID=82996 RepID=UPI003DA481DF